MNASDELIARLPQKAPFLFLREVAAVVPGVSATGAARFDADHPLFAGHMPGHPVVPGVLVIEALAQLCGIVLLRDDATSSVGWLADVAHLRFRRLVAPGERIDLAARLERSFGTTAKFDVEARVGAALAAEGVLTIGGMSAET